MVEVGTDDVAYQPLSQQIEAIKNNTDTFIYSSNFYEGNLYLSIAEDGTHDYEYALSLYL